MNSSFPPSPAPASGPAFPADTASASSPNSVVSRRRVLALAASFPLAACGGSDGSSPPTATPAPPATGTPSPPAGEPAPAPTPTPPAGKSAKRGIAYDLRDAADLAALAPGISWWYNWSPRTTLSSDNALANGVDFQPMLWNGVFDDAAIEAELKARPSVKYLLLLNEPNLNDQAVMSPADAAALWPRYEALAAKTGVKLVGPAMTWGTLAGYADPVVWLDAFYAAYRSAHGNRDPRIDHLAFHWYDYGLGAQLDRLLKYGKPFWVTEFANWHSQADGAQIDSVAKQKAQMTDMVATCEARADVFRYAWFTGRWPKDIHHTSLLGNTGELTELGRHYLSLPFAG